jgi:hypothetical protein
MIFKKINWFLLFLDNTKQTSTPSRSPNLHDIDNLVDTKFRFRVAWSKIDFSRF